MREIEWSVVAGRQSYNPPFRNLKKFISSMEEAATQFNFIQSSHSIQKEKITFFFHSI